MPGYAKRLASARRGREQKQARYVESFEASVLAFLNFAPLYQQEARYLARLIAEQATPVGSGTVARTQRIPIEERAEAAVIAWMRHQTTAYEHMQVPKVKGMRRALRRRLAARSRQLLGFYRRAEKIPDGCPLKSALKRLELRKG